MQNELDEQELKRIWLLFLYKETIENDRHCSLDKKALLELDSRPVFDKILSLQIEQKRAVALFCISTRTILLSHIKPLQAALI
jgi:hypothetical protein